MTDRIPAGATDMARRRAIAALRLGQAVALPTDTVYAIVADAFNSTAMEAVRRAKRRGRQTPFSVIIRSPRQVTGLVSQIPEAADRLMAAYWPGPLTLVFASAEGLGWDLGDTLGTIGLRMPTDDLLLSVIAEVGPLACTGANVEAATPIHDVDAAEEALGGSVALYIDGGRRERPVSTIVDVTSDNPVVLREGAISEASVQKVASGELPWGQRPENGAAQDPTARGPAAGGTGP